LFLSQKRQFFVKFFCENTFKNITSVPDEYIKNAQNVARSVFVKINICITFTEENSRPKIWASFTILEKLPKVNNCPMCESGYPALQRTSICNFGYFNKINSKWMDKLRAFNPRGKIQP
jgi:hypothetical protein